MFYHYIGVCKNLAIFYIKHLCETLSTPRKSDVGPSNFGALLPTSFLPAGLRMKSFPNDFKSGPQNAVPSPWRLLLGWLAPPGSPSREMIQHFSLCLTRTNR